MNNKYYTPQLEDLFINYEFEYKINKNPEIWRKSNLWDISTIDEDCIKSAEYFISKNEIRTKYLDKEDIESLGYIYETNYGDFLSFEKGNPYYLNGQLLYYNLDNHLLRISINKENYDNQGVPINQVIFDGECKSINELKKILKYLKIE